MERTKAALDMLKVYNDTLEPVVDSSIASFITMIPVLIAIMWVLNIARIIKRISPSIQDEPGHEEDRVSEPEKPDNNTTE